MRMRVGIIIFLLPMIVWGGDWSISGSYYSREEVLHPATVRSGVVLTAREVTLEPSTETKAASTTVGAALGGVLVHAAFGEKGGMPAMVASGIGGILGGLAGSAAAGAWFAPRGCEVMMKLDNGEVIAVVQQENRCPQPGQRVDLISTTWGKTRVVVR